MVELANLTAFFGWCTVINGLMLILATTALVFAGDSVARIHSRMFGMDAGELPKLYFDYLGRLKTLILVFNLVPYFALKIIA